MSSILAWVSALSLDRFVFFFIGGSFLFLPGFFMLLLWQRIARKARGFFRIISLHPQGFEDGAGF